MRRTKEQTMATREALLDAAERVFFRRGVARASLEEIAREAGMTRGALYWHFRDKEALYASMLERVRLPLDETELMAEHIADPFAALEHFARRALERVTGCEQVWRVYSIALLRREHLPPDAALDDVERQLRESTRSAFIAAFRRADEQGQLRSDITPELAAIAMQCHLIGMLYLGMQEPDTFHLLDDGLRMTRCFLAGYRAG